MPKVYIIDGNYQYTAMFEAAGWDTAKGPLDADLIQFTGGEDVSPCLYGEGRHPYTGDSLERDLYEAGYFGFAQRMKIPVAGICRGGQFLNVMSGGKMYQHVSNHATGRNHLVFDLESNTEIECSSTHHQMMIPSGQAVVLGTAYMGGFKECVDKSGSIVRIEGSAELEDTEVVYYPHTNALCFQPHPEFFNKEHECFEYYFECINRCFGLSA